MSPKHMPGTCCGADSWPSHPATTTPTTTPTPNATTTPTGTPPKRGRPGQLGGWSTRGVEEHDVPSRSQKEPPIPAALGGCPGNCHTAVAERLQVALGTLRAAATRPMMPELLILCRQCRRQFVVSV